MKMSAPASPESTWDEEQFGVGNLRSNIAVRAQPAAFQAAPTKHTMFSIDGDNVDMSEFFDDGGFV